MNLERQVIWTNKAKKQLLAKARYIFAQSQNALIAQKFYRDIQSLTEKLAYFSVAYDDGKFHLYTVKNGHSVKFIVRGEFVYIAEFLAKGREFII